MTPNQVTDWLIDAPVGATAVYFTGELSRICETLKPSDDFSLQEKLQAREIRRHVQALYENGVVALTQKRVPTLPGQCPCFDYRITKLRDLHAPKVRRSA